MRPLLMCGKQITIDVADLYIVCDVLTFVESIFDPTLA